jgi:hypothetical protein
MKTSILVPVGAIGALVAAVVLASPMATDTAAIPATMPNRAEVFAAVTCGDLAASTVSDQQGWQDALGSKRVLERNLMLAGGTVDQSAGCAIAG